MGVSKGPQTHVPTRPARLLGEVGEKAGGDRAMRALRIDGGAPGGRTMMGKDDDLSARFALRDLRDLRIEPREIGLVGATVVFHRPVADVVEVVEAEADLVVLGWQDQRVQGASEDGQARGDIVTSLVQENKLTNAAALLGGGQSTLGDLVGKLLELTLRVRPGGMVGLVIPKKEKDNLELENLRFQETKDRFIFDVTNVPEKSEPGGFRRDGEDIVRWGCFQVQIGHDLKLGHD